MQIFAENCGDVLKRSLICSDSFRSLFAAFFGKSCVRAFHTDELRYLDWMVKLAEADPLARSGMMPSNWAHIEWVLPKLLTRQFVQI